MRKRGAIPPLSKRQHQRNNVVERVCRIEAAPLPAAVVVRLVRPYNPYQPYHPYPLSTQNRFCSNEPSARVTTFAFSGAAWKPTIQVYTATDDQTAGTSQRLQRRRPRRRGDRIARRFPPPWSVEGCDPLAT